MNKICTKCGTKWRTKFFLSEDWRENFFSNDWHSEKNSHSWPTFWRVKTDTFWHSPRTYSMKNQSLHWQAYICTFEKGVNRISVISSIFCCCRYWKKIFIIKILHLFYPQILFSVPHIHTYMRYVCTYICAMCVYVCEEWIWNEKRKRGSLLPIKM